MGEYLIAFPSPGLSSLSDLATAIHAAPDTAIRVSFLAGSYACGGFVVESNVQKLTLEASIVGSLVVFDCSLSDAVAVEVNGVDEILLSGLTFRHSNNPIGGVSINGSRVIQISDCVFDANIARGLDPINSSPPSYNPATFSGGGGLRILAQSSSSSSQSSNSSSSIEIVISNTLFSANQQLSPTANGGGGVLIAIPDPELQPSISLSGVSCIENLSTGGNGGGCILIWFNSRVENGNVAVTRGYFQSNVAEAGE